MSNNPGGYRAVLRHKQYAKLIAANVVNRFGDSVDAIAFTWLVYELSGDPTWSAVIFGVNMLPTVLLGPFIGPLAERMNKKRTMVFADIIRGLLVALTAGLYALGLLTPVLMLLITLTHSTVEAFRVPCGTAIVPRLLPKEDYDFGTSLNGSLSRVMEVMGLVSAAGIIALFDISGAILIDGITFFLSALFIAWIRLAPGKGETSVPAGQTYGQTLREGFSYAFKNRPILHFCLLALLLNSLLVPFNALSAPLVKDMYHLGPEAMSGGGILLAGGMALGSFLYPYLKRKLSGKRIIILSLLAISLCYAALTALRHLLALPVLFAVGIVFTLLIFSISLALLSAYFSVAVLRLVSPDYLARIGATLGAISTAAMPVTSFLVSGLTSFLSLPAVFYTFAGICFVSLLLLLKFHALDDIDVERSALNETELPSAQGPDAGSTPVPES